MWNGSNCCHSNYEHDQTCRLHDSFSSHQDPLLSFPNGKGLCTIMLLSMKTYTEQTVANRGQQPVSLLGEDLILLGECPLTVSSVQWQAKGNLSKSDQVGNILCMMHCQHLPQVGHFVNWVMHGLHNDFGPPPLCPDSGLGHNGSRDSTFEDLPTEMESVREYLYLFYIILFIKTVFIGSKIKKECETYFSFGFFFQQMYNKTLL